MAASLFVILARNGRDAVIFRRGPSKQVLLINWDRRRDRFEIGQWFKGRIFERRCDLSPSGEMLVYLAAKHKGPIGTWTAISRPPYLTALALWQNLGTYGGGGLFESEYSLLLNHDSVHRKLADGFQLPKAMRVHPLGHDPGRGEDSPIYDARLLRDGWILKYKGKSTKYDGDAHRLAVHRAAGLREMHWASEADVLFANETARHKRAIRSVVPAGLRGIE